MHIDRVNVHGFRAASSSPLECQIPGRFSVLAGANSSGKSTVADSILLAHRDVFPYTPRPSRATLSSTVSSRTIEISYAVEPGDPSPLGSLLATQGVVPSWTTELTSSMGRVATSHSESQAAGQLPILYLSPTRNPAQELGGRDARLVVELLKAQAFRETGDKSLRDLRGRLGGLIGSVVGTSPIAGSEVSVGTHLAELTGGVAARAPFLGTTSVDDVLLGRIFEFLSATAGDGRAEALRLETEGLGYANLLHIAIILAAIPDLTGAQGTSASTSDAAVEIEADSRTDDERREALTEAEDQRELEDDSFFAGQFHSTVLLEEPEAHLHPQLQHGLIEYLRELVAKRPELQVVITTHSDEIVAACDPTELVVFTRDVAGTPASRTIATFDLSDTYLNRTRRHLDVNRSASLFTERLVLVEGITDAMVLRALAPIWAGSDERKRRFAVGLAITVVGSRVGEWMPSLLTRPGAEISVRLAVLRDGDGNPEPGWIGRRRGDRFDAFVSDPTLEPSLVRGNEAVIGKTLAAMKVAKSTWADPKEPTDTEVAAWISGKGGRRKAEFADQFARYCRRRPAEVTVPDHIEALFDFVWDGFATPVAEAAHEEE